MWSSPNYVSYLYFLFRILYQHRWVGVCVRGARLFVFLATFIHIITSTMHYIETKLSASHRIFISFVPLASLNLICIFSTMHVIISWYLPVLPYSHPLNCDFTWFLLLSYRIRGSRTAAIHLVFDLITAVCAFGVRLWQFEKIHATTTAITFKWITLLH